MRLYYFIDLIIVFMCLRYQVCFFYFLLSNLILFLIFNIRNFLASIENEEE